MTEQELKLAYQAQEPALFAWGKWIKETVLARLDTELARKRKISDFLKIPPEPRVKEVDSFLTKALRRNKNYDRPLEQITDKVGIRFIVLLLPELNVIRKILENSDSWEAEKARDFETEKTDRPNYFDYQSIHYIVRAKRPMKCGEITIPAQMPCEVQVRTLLQHAYAELAHDTTYKPSLTLSRDINRQLAKSSALVEATDEIFVGVYKKIQAATAELKRVHEVTAKLYQKHIGDSLNIDDRLTARLLDPYRSELVGLTSESLEEYLSEYDFIAERVRERAPLSILFRHPVVLAIYFLVSNEPDSTPKRWPAELKELEPIYSDLGISTDGRLW